MRLANRAGRTLRFLGIDQAVAFTLAGHFWNVFSAPLLLFLVLWRLAAAERGVLFNYVSICQFQILLELGIGTAMQQLASRERAALLIGPSGTFTGDPAAKARLAVIFRIALVWFIGIALMSNLVLFPIGWHFFSSAPGVEGVDWQVAWVLSVLVSSVQGLVYSLFLFLGGCGEVTPVSRVNAAQNVTMTITQSVALVLGARLLSHPFAGMGGLAVSLSWIFLTRRRMLRDLWATDSKGAGLAWRSDVWPLQWRISLSWLSLILVIQILNVVTMWFHGAEAAGRVGLSMYILMAIQAIGSGWIGTKVPTFGVLAAQKKWAELNALFRSVLIRAGAFIGVLMLLPISANIALYRWGGDWNLGSVAGAESGTMPLVEPHLFALLAVAVFAMFIVHAQAAFLRAHCREPMLKTYVVLALVVLIALVIAATHGITTMIVAYTICVLVLGLGRGTWIFVTTRRRLHRV